MSLTTPDKIRTLQRKLYLKAKAEPDFRFYLLYDKVYRADILRHAYDLARANRGAPGVDGVDFAAIEAAGREDWLHGIETDLRTKTYQPQPVRRVMIPKPGGGERPLGIPTIRDRVVQTAAKLVLEPIFEADLEPTAYGYRPGRSGIDAVKAVHRLLCQGFTDVVDADLSKYFDTIPHDDLLRSVAARIVDRHVLRLIKLWLKAPVEETDPDGRRRMSGGKHSTCGTPQGGVISPPTILQKAVLPAAARVAGGGWVDAEDDVDVLAVDLDALHKEADQIPPLMPVQPVHAGVYPAGEVLKTADDEGQRRLLSGLVPHGLDLRLPFLGPPSKAGNPWLEFRPVDQPLGVTVNQPPHSPLQLGKLRFGRGEIDAATSVPPRLAEASFVLRCDPDGVAQQPLDFLPDSLVQPIGANLRIRAHPLAAEPIGVAAATAIIGVVAPL